MSDTMPVQNEQTKIGRLRCQFPRELTSTLHTLHDSCNAEQAADTEPMPEDERSSLLSASLGVCMGLPGA